MRFRRGDPWLARVHDAPTEWARTVIKVVDMVNEETHYIRIAAAYVRGRYAQSAGFTLPDRFVTAPLDELSVEELSDIVRLGDDSGLRLDRYKRSNILPRVSKVLGALQGIRPSSLLDIGSGRGAFLWPLVDALPWLPITSIDAGENRADQLKAVMLGGLPRFTAHHMDATALNFADGSFDVVTALEVLEHIPQIAHAVNEVCRVSRRFVIASVPSKEDNNPEHIHLLGEAEIRDLFSAAGASQVTFDYVLNHRIAIIRASPVPL